MLFGSRGPEAAHTHSDFDLLIIQRSNAPRFARASAYYRAVSDLPMEVDIVVVMPEEVRDWQRVPKPLSPRLFGRAGRFMKIPCTHNLYKLRNLCPETDPSLRELIDAAELLTPFAVEARWPCSETLEQAQRNANRVADFVSARLRSVAWNVARARFDWRVDLRHFKDATKHPGFFDRVIEPANIVLFENTFRTALVPGGRRERAAEVAFWKNYGNFRGRDRITRDLFEWIEGPESWTRFAAAVEALAITPTWKAFQTAHHLLRPDVRVRYATYVSFVLRSTKIPYGRQENRRMVVWSISKRT